MTALKNLSRQSAPAFELKARMMTLSILRVLSADIANLFRQLDAKIATAPDLFQNFPILLDFEDLPEDAQRGFDIAQLNWQLRDRSFVPVGLRGAGDVLTGIAAGVGIGVIAAAPERVRKQAKSEATQPIATNMLIRQPVRSGQQIYAEGGDAIILSTVSPGAEVLADGNIHIYGSLRGRALAGVRGNTEARIFCHDLDPELIAIAGHYCLSDSIDESRRGTSVQIFLRDESLIIEGLQAQRLETTK